MVDAVEVFDHYVFVLFLDHGALPKQRVEHRAILGLCSADFILEIHSSGNCSSTAFFASAVERDLCLKYVCSAQTEPHQSRGACAVSEEYLPVPSPYHSQLNRF